MTNKPIMLDSFCGVGGAGMGYHRAGFEVVGVDIEPQPHYPFEFHQCDALKFIAAHGREFDAIHASTPCQFYSDTYNLPNVAEYPDLIAPVRSLILTTGKPYVMENVDNAPLENPLMLCGTMFGLKLIRHRLFECRPPVWFPPGPCQCHHLFTNSARGFSSFDNGATAITVAGNNYPLKDGMIAMGIDWATNRGELSEAIPPAYTEYIGRRIMELMS